MVAILGPLVFTVMYVVMRSLALWMFYVLADYNIAILASIFMPVSSTLSILSGVR